MNAKDITKKFHFTLHHKYHDKYARVNQYRHWMWIVCAFGILSLIVLTLSVTMYYQIIRGNFFKVSEEPITVAETVDAAKIQAVVNFYEGKRERFEKERIQPSVFVDPGI